MASYVVSLAYVITEILCLKRLSNGQSDKDID